MPRNVERCVLAPPQSFDPVTMTMTTGKLIVARIDTKMLVITDIDQHSWQTEQNRVRSQAPLCLE